MNTYRITEEYDGGGKLIAENRSLHEIAHALIQLQNNPHLESGLMKVTIERTDQ